MKITELIIKFLLRKETETMDVVLATLIDKGLRTYKKLSSLMKERVKPILIALEREDLIVEDNTNGNA